MSFSYYSEVFVDIICSIDTLLIKDCFILHFQNVQWRSIRWKLYSNLSLLISVLDFLTVYITQCSCLSVFFPGPYIIHHGGECLSRHPELCLPRSGVRRQRAARKPLPAFPETRLGLHSGQLHQVPDCHLGVAHCS